MMSPRIESIECSVPNEEGFRFEAGAELASPGRAASLAVDAGTKVLGSQRLPRRCIDGNEVGSTQSAVLILNYQSSDCVMCRLLDARHRRLSVSNALRLQ